MPVLVIAFVLVAVVKPWGGPRSADVTPAAPSGIAVVSSAAPVTATASAVTLVTDGTPVAAEPIYAHEIESVPWANELAADAGGAWAWSDTGVVRRVATSDLVQRTDLGRPDGAPGPLGSRGIAVAWSQVWASDGAHLGLARLDGDTGAVAQRIPLWATDTPTTVDRAGGSPNDRWASASGFAIDGDSIFLPSIAPRPNDVVAPAGADGQLWRIDTTGTGPATW
ncbi:MAG: hypothetical protein ACJ779_08360, partial [Chloroflexota bacterium]